MQQNLLAGLDSLLGFAPKVPSRSIFVKKSLTSPHFHSIVLYGTQSNEEEAMGRPSDARQRLIGAAREVIYAHSYEAVTVDELCATAGVTKSSFYHFFSSKQELVLVALDSQWQWFEQTFLRPTFLDHLPPQEQIVRFFDLIQ